MSYNPKTNRYQAGYDLAITEGVFSNAASWAGAGAGIGAFGSTLGQGIGAAIGFVAGAFIGGFTARADYRNKVRSELEVMQQDRKKYTKKRNLSISIAKRTINSTKADFDTTYGKGMFSKYDTLFTDIFKKNTNQESTLRELFTNMKYDTVAGQIQTKLSGIGSEGFNFNMSLSDINEAYYQYFSDEMRNANTMFGESMRGLKMKEGEAYANYQDDVNSLNIELGKQFHDTFLQRVGEKFSEQLEMGGAESAQGSSGLKGGNLSNIQKFKNDLASVAYASSLKYLMNSYKHGMQKTNGSYINTVYEIRHQADMDIAGQLSQLVKDYNEMNNDLYTEFETSREMEGNINETTSGMREAESFLNDSNSRLDDDAVNITDDIASNTMEDIF